MPCARVAEPDDITEGEGAPHPSERGGRAGPPIVRADAPQPLDIAVQRCDDGQRLCHAAVIDFGQRMLSAADVTGRKVLEVGSRVVQEQDRTMRHHIEALGPAQYLGVDIIDGYGVDMIADASNLLDHFGPNSWDTVVCTEVVEHVADWRKVFHNLKGVLREGGALLLTTRSPGFQYHGYPYDFWRYTVDDMNAIFGDMDAEVADDPSAPGVFVFARKPTGFLERDLTGIRLYSIIGRKRRDASPPRIAREAYVAALMIYRKLRARASRPWLLGAPPR
jgi:SAM-dependent methyltransferase